MSGGVRRGWLMAALAVAVVALVGSIAAVAARSGGNAPTVFQRPGVPGDSGYGPGMMGGDPARRCSPNGSAACTPVR